MSTFSARTVLVALFTLSACGGGSAEPQASTSSAADVSSSTVGARESAPTANVPSTPTAMVAAPGTSAVAGAASANPASGSGVAGAQRFAAGSGGSGGMMTSAAVSDGSASATVAAAGSGGSASATNAAAGSSGSTTAVNMTAGNAGTGSAVSTAAGSGGASSPPVLGQDCTVDPLANEAPFGSGFFQQFRGLMGCTAAADLALYREMLPAKFEMPANPQVCFYTLDFMISGVGPYHEAALLLPIEYAGMSGKYVLTMPLDNAAATSGGRAVGFPKYMSDVTLMQQGNDWSARAGGATADLEVEYTGECVAEDVFLWPDFINLTPIPTGETSSQAFLPPRDGRALMVPAEQLTEPKFYSLRGRVLLSIGDHLPWNGLVDEMQPFTGYLTTFKGGIDLGNRPLD